MNVIKKKIHNAFIEGNLISKSFKYLFNFFILDIFRKISWNILIKQKKIVKNKIIFITFQGNYTCNPKYITEQLINENTNCKIVWSINDYSLKDQFPKDIKLVKINSFSFLNELADSSIIVMNSIGFYDNFPLPIRKKQIIIQTWHGSLGIKRFTGDNIRKYWKKTGIKNGLRTNYCISNSNFEDMVYRTTFWSESEYLKYGHPRNDILFLTDNESKEKIKSKILSFYKITGNPNIILYAPTFRDIRNISCYNLNYDMLLDAVKKRFKYENCVVFTRFHNSEINLSNIVNLNKTINVTEYPDIQELLFIADIAITDYSSWIYDFILMEKPGFIYAEDIKDYNTERGFYYSLESTPFPISSNNNELYNNIIDFNEELYNKKRKEFLIDKGCIEDGNASIRTAQKIKELMGE